MKLVLSQFFMVGIFNNGDMQSNPKANAVCWKETPHPQIPHLVRLQNRRSHHSHYLPMFLISGRTVEKSSRFSLNWNHTENKTQAGVSLTSLALRSSGQLRLLWAPLAVKWLKTPMRKTSVSSTLPFCSVCMSINCQEERKTTVETLCLDNSILKFISQAIYLLK